MHTTQSHRQELNRSTHNIGVLHANNNRTKQHYQGNYLDMIFDNSVFIPAITLAIPVKKYEINADDNLTQILIQIKVSNI